VIFRKASSIASAGSVGLSRTSASRNRCPRGSLPNSLPSPSGRGSSKAEGEGSRLTYRTVKTIDFDNPDANDWLAVNQFTVVENKHNRRPDVLIFVNGLPLGVVELKNAADEDATI